jgi:hypothetical protein
VPATYPNLVRHAALLRNVLAVAPRIMVAAAQALLRLMLPPPGGLMVLPRTMAVGVLRLAEPPFQMGLCGMHNRKDRGTIYFVIVTAHICAVCSTRRGRGFSPLWKTSVRFLSRNKGRCAPLRYIQQLVWFSRKDQYTTFIDIFSLEKWDFHL